MILKWVVGNDRAMGYRVKLTSLICGDKVLPGSILLYIFENVWGCSYYSLIKGLKRLPFFIVITTFLYFFNPRY